MVECANDQPLNPYLGEKMNNTATCANCNKKFNHLVSVCDNCGSSGFSVTLLHTTMLNQSNLPVLKIKKLSDDAVIPKYNRVGDAGFDLSAIEDYTIMPGETVLVKTGLAFEIPSGKEVQIRPRSGLSLKSKLRISNSPGTIDENYKGEIGIIVDNIGNLPYFVKKGDRIAQGVVAPVVTVIFEEISELSESERGDKGFGSSGV